MKKTVIDTTVKNGLCVSCGICESVCPKKCIDTGFLEGQFIPKIDFDKCINCGICSDICSTHNMEFSKYADINKQDLNENIFVGNYRGTYNGYAKNQVTRSNSTSGGLITEIVNRCLEMNLYEKAFLVDDFSYSDIVETKPYIKSDNFTKTSKSRYIPVSHKKMVEYVLENRDKKIIIVATSCVVHTFLNVIDKYNLVRDNYLILGLFCDRTFNQNIYSYFKDYSNEMGELKNLYFRTKEQVGWPGNVKLEFRDGSSIFLEKNERMKIKDYFQIESCLYCIDKLNQFADISFGDNYTKVDADKLGSNSIIIRTGKGKDVIDSVNNSSILLTEIEIERILKSQKIREKESNLKFASIFLDKEGVNLYPGLVSLTDSNQMNHKQIDEFDKRKKLIEIGKKYPLSIKILRRKLKIADSKMIVKRMIKRLLKS